MKTLVILMFLLGSTAFAGPIDYQRDVYPVFAKNCAGCHNANTPGMNWLDSNVAMSKRTLIYDRVFLKGDMPLFFKYFGGKDKEILRKWLEWSDPQLKSN